MSEGSQSAPASPELVAGRYEVLARLAQGGMGEVLKVRERDGRELALKRLLPTAERARALFQAEYHALARLKHPHIVAVYDYGLDDGRPYYTMELLSGHDLRDCGRVSLGEACLHLRDVATSLALLHAQRLVHRDISPRNVRKTEGGRCKLFDFGAMVPFGVPPNVAGTSPFISPEAWEGAMLDQRSDLYSLGALAYFLLSGQLHAQPRPLDKRRPERALPARLSRIVPNLPTELDDLVMSMLEADPGRRPWSAHEVIAQLDVVADLPRDDTAALASGQLGSSHMIGRKREAATLTRALKRAQQYEGSALVVEGAPGVGKSRLLEELGWLAQTHGFSVVRGFGAHGEGSLGLASQLYAQLKRCVPEADKRLTDAERATLSVLDAARTTRPPAGTHDDRSAVQWALTAYVRAATRESAVLVVVDDLDQADEFSASFVTALSYIANTRPLLVVASCTPQYGTLPSLQLTQLAQEARTLTLNALGAHETRALVAEALGRPPHYARFADFVYREAHGNPGATLAIASYLVRRGVIGYANGRFVLPEGEIHAQLPGAEAGPPMLRLLDLPKPALALLEVLALCRYGGTLALCLAATDLGQAALLEAFEELVRAGVLVSAGQSYAFAQATLRSTVREGISPERARTVHTQLARALLGGSDASLSTRLEAGYHLLHSERELEGALLLAEICPKIIATSADCSAALEALEQTLPVFDRHPHTFTVSTRTLTVLARSAYLSDYRLMLRHGARTIDTLTRWTGIAVLQRLLPYFGSAFVLVLCMLVVAVRRCFRPRADRGPGPFESVQLIGRAFVSYLGVYTLALDGPEVTRLVRFLEPYGGAPPPTSGRAVYLCCRAFALHPFGREAELDAALAEAHRALDADRLIGMGEDERRDLRVGLMLSGGINEAYRIGSHALARADELEAQGTPLARAAAYRVRFTYYQSRGMRDRAERYRRKLEVHGIQGGTTWQVEWFAAPLVGLTSAIFGDIVGATEALERLERLCKELPSLTPKYELVRMSHNVITGDYAAAIAAGERFVRANPPFSSIGWGGGYATYARALNLVGRHADARDVCLAALSALSPAEREFVIMYGTLEHELASAYAGLGQPAQALATIDAYLLRLQEAEEHALVAFVLAHRVALSSMAHDHEAFARDLVRMREAAERSGSSSVIHQASNVARAASRATDDLLALALPAANDEHHASSTQTGPLPNGSDRAATPRKGIAVSKRRSLLRRVMDHAGASAACMFGRPEADGTLRVLANAGAEPDVEAALPEAMRLWTQLATAPLDQAPAWPEPHRPDGKAYSLSVLPICVDGERLPLALLYLFSERTGPMEPPPTTWLSELAQRARHTRSESREHSTERTRQLSPDDGEA